MSRADHEFISVHAGGFAQLSIEHDAARRELARLSRRVRELEHERDSLFRSYRLLLRWLEGGSLLPVPVSLDQLDLPLVGSTHDGSRVLDPDPAELCDHDPYADHDPDEDRETWELYDGDDRAWLADQLGSLVEDLRAGYLEQQPMNRNPRDK